MTPSLAGVALSLTGLVLSLAGLAMSASALWPKRMSCFMHFLGKFVLF